VNDAKTLRERLVGGMRARVALMACVVTSGMLVAAAPANAAFSISAFDGLVSDGQGGSYSQAAGHPESASVTFQLNRIFDQGLLEADGGDLRDSAVDLPPGLIGNPTAVPACPQDVELPRLITANSDVNEFCPANTIVGSADVYVSLGPDGVERFVGPVFNMEPPPGVPARFGFIFFDQKAILDAHVRSDGDYGIKVVTRNANQSKPIVGATVTLWGVPADHSHDTRRCLGYFNPPDGETTIPEGAPLSECNPDPFMKIIAPWLAPSPANVKPQAFLTNPTACTPAGVGLETRMTVTSWNPASAPAQASFVSHELPGWPAPPADWGAPEGPEGCADVPFDALVEAHADTRKADAPSGLSVDLSFPQFGLTSPTGLAAGHLKRATVTLPEGWTVSPSSADGLVGCSDAQSSIGTLLGARCPEASKIGTVEATTLLLKEKLEGGVYVGTQESDDPLSGRMFRMFIALNSEERGIRVKLPGQIRVNPATGRIETTFDNNPQVPVSTISLKLKSGPRAPLATPFDCGTKSVTADLESWTGARILRTSDLAIDCPGGGPLAPAFKAGVANSRAGKHTSFTVRVDRQDGQKVIDNVAVRLPPGLLATLKGVPRCADPNAAAGTCPEGSRVGTATVGSGPGTNPFFLQGGVYLTGPYKNGPFGLAVAVRAKAGPFDLGTVVVRQQLLVDPTDAHVTVVSDPLPTILKGVPIRMRTLKVDVDRPNFTLNPTSCAPKSVFASFGAPDGSRFNTSSPFGVSNCAALPLKPKLKLALTGRRQTTDGTHPGVGATLTQRRGDANLKRVQVKLPLSLALDPDNAQALCEFRDGTKVDPTCPKGSIVGRARAVTPILDKPLTAPVYFVKNVRIDPRSGRQIRTLPMLVIPLRGENGIKLNLKGTSSVSKNHLVTTFNAIPDAPVSRFDLTIKGGRNGILVTDGSICRKRQVADVDIDGQNNKASDRNTTLTTSACKRANKQKRR
jgi:hypothetical protein